LYSDSRIRRVDLLICIGAVIVAVLVDPRGDFPLSDDWSYAYTARGICESGNIEFLPWTGASVLFQAAYGALACKIVGFSFTVLRLSTIVMATLGAIALNHLLTALGTGPKTTGLAVAAFALNPLYVSQSFTFMTDVPFTTLSLIAAALYVSGLSGAHIGKLVAASVVAAAAILIRQHGIFVVGAAGLAALLARDVGLGRRVGAASAATLIPIAVLVGFHLWLFTSHGTPAGLQNKLSETSLATTVAFVDHGFRAAVTLSLALLPIAALRALGVLSDRRGTFAVLACLLGAGAVVLYFNDGSTMFYLPNVQYDFGLGALTLRDSLFLSISQPSRLGPIVTIPLTIVSILAAAVLATSVLQSRRPAGAAPATAALGETFVAIAAVALFVGSLLLHGAFYFDRYLIPVIPFAIAAMVANHRDDKTTMPVAIITLVIAVYAVTGTHDYLSMNRARFGILADLEEAGVTTNRIDGGFEYNAWHSAATLGNWPTKESARRGQALAEKSWWWVEDDEFIVSSSPLEGYDVALTRPYSTWLRRGRGELLLLERNRRP
jgi:hypothetical protein